jgi:ATP-dependent DNA helicase RecQ
MGINKPNVRYVLHRDLPKSIEGYYQETGRAGRDGLGAECLLLFSNGDAVRYLRFFDEITDEGERQISRKQLDEMVWYAESAACRRRDLLAYFGEAFEAESCGACDNCQSPRKTFDATEVAKKILGALVSIKRKGGFSVGGSYVAEVLIGSSSERLRRWGHDTTPDFGSGKDRTAKEWAALARDLVRAGYLRRDVERFNVLDLTEKGRAVLEGRIRATLTEAPEIPAAPRRAVAMEYDEGLFERLRVLRKRLADEQKVQAFVIFSDVSLRQMAREYPATDEEFSRISGVGERKLRDFGEMFMAEIAEHLRSNPRRMFERSASNLRGARPRELGDSPTITLRLFRDGKSVDEIARERGVASSTVFGHLAYAAEAGEEIDLGRFLTEEQEPEIAGAFGALGWQNIAGVRDRLGQRYAWGVLRIYRALRMPDKPAAAPKDEDPIARATSTVVEGESASASATAFRTTGCPARSPASAPAPA